MKYTIDEEIGEKLGLDFSEVLGVMLVKTGVNVPELYGKLVEKEVLVKCGSNYLVTQRWDEVCDRILLSSDTSIPKESELLELALKLMDLFPKGKKAGTNNHWKGNKREVIMKLQKFYKLYGFYTADEIYDATKAYVEYHKNDTSIMRTLKYFILKNDNVKGEISDLATWLENRNQETESIDWTSELK